MSVACDVVLDRFEGKRLMGSPDGHGALAGAIGWIGRGLTGPAATMVATLAIAAAGVLLLGGRLPIRRGAMAIFGCFVVFSASTVARGIIASIEAPISAPVSTDVSALSMRYQAPAAAPFDPYAGAAVPLPQEQPVIR